ncbi:MAG: SPASM domain-containing protein, partial [Candidatus Dormibacteraceae bacterium]
IQLRVSVIGVEEGQDVAMAVDELHQIGVEQVGVDWLRGVGRGVRAEPSSVKQLCGHCANNTLAILPDGSAYPCIMSRWLPVGDVKQSSLAEIHEEGAVPVRQELLAQFQATEQPEPKPKPQPQPACLPLGCMPRCSPIMCGPGCCKPVYGDKHPSSGG